MIYSSQQLILDSNFYILGNSYLICVFLIFSYEILLKSLFVPNSGSLRYKPICNKKIFGHIRVTGNILLLAIFLSPIELNLTVPHISGIFKHFCHKSNKICCFDPKCDTLRKKQLIAKQWLFFGQKKKKLFKSCRKFVWISKLRNFG